MAKKNSSLKSASKIPAKTTAKAAAPKTGIESLSPAAKDSRGYKEIAETQLERFPNRNRRRAYTVEFTCPEFTCVCPKTGFPDFATIFIRYQPDEWCVELKSLKLYINKFRDMGVYHEDVTNVIADDLIGLLDPNQIEIVADFTVRGNIHTVVTVNHSKSSMKMDD